MAAREDRVPSPAKKPAAKKARKSPRSRTAKRRSPRRRQEAQEGCQEGVAFAGLIPSVSRALWAPRGSARSAQRYSDASRNWARSSQKARSRAAQLVGRATKHLLGSSTTMGASKSRLVLV